MMKEIDVAEKASQLKKDYQKNYRKNHKEAFKTYQERYWTRKAVIEQLGDGEESTNTKTSELT